MNSDFIKAPRLTGAQIVYSWKELEPHENSYDFREIQKDRDSLAAKGKKLFIQIQDTTFTPDRVAVPKYIQSDPKYNGGVVCQYDDNGKPAGWVMMRWESAVAERFHMLLNAIGKAFDGKIEGIALQETAIDVVVNGKPVPRNFSYEKYRYAIEANMKAAKQSFSQSVVIQYANFMPGEWLPDDDHAYLRSIFQFAQGIGVGVGAPDLLPDKKGYRNHCYKFMHEMRGTILVGVAVQDGNYIGKTNDTSVPGSHWPNRVPALSDFAVNFLGASYIFWGAQEPYFSRDVVPYFQ